MLNNIREINRRLLKSTVFKNYRYLFDNFNIKNRLTGIVGPRGTGKTVLLLQYMKEKLPDISKAIYVSLDNIYFSNNTLLGFVDELYNIDGIKIFFLDEIHKYNNWNQELKNIYDSYPDVKVIFSGSSSLDLVKGSYDLSRRGVMYKLKGMSFREYLKFNEIADIRKYSFTELISGDNDLNIELEKIDRIKGIFKEYLRMGYYPFVMEGKDTYYQKINNTIEKTIYIDISNFYRLKTSNLYYFKKIISYIATIPPGDLSRNSISKHIGLDNKTVQHYLNILQDTGIVKLISDRRAGSSILKSREKIYLDNQDLYYAISEWIGYTCKLGTVRETFFVNMILNSGLKLFHCKTGDFEVNNKIFEIGGKSKSKRQIKDSLEKSYLVKDDIFYSSKNVLPLIFFGFLY